MTLPLGENNQVIRATISRNKIAKHIITINKKAIFATQLFDSKKSLEPSTTLAELKSLNPDCDDGDAKSIPAPGSGPASGTGSGPAPGPGDASAPGSNPLSESPKLRFFDDGSSIYIYIYIYIYIIDIKYLYTA
jgi:hypothetical protein